MKSCTDDVSSEALNCDGIGTLGLFECLWCLRLHWSCKPSVVILESDTPGFITAQIYVTTTALRAPPILSTMQGLGDWVYLQT